MVGAKGRGTADVVGAEAWRAAGNLNDERRGDAATMGGGKCRAVVSKGTKKLGAAGTGEVM